jgi:hypothetical protein
VRKRLLGLICFGVLLFGCTACYSGNESGPKVAVVGDSITYLSQSDIAATLGTDYAYRIEDFPGATMHQMFPQIEDELHDPQGAPDDFIVNLGTNDVETYAVNGTAWQASLYYESVVLQPTKCVIFVNVSTYADQYADGQPIAEAINTAIAQSVAVNPNFHLLDWNAWVHTGNNYSNYIIPSSGVHPNAAGEQQLANLYAQALQTDCGGS